MNKLEQLLQELCPAGVEYKELSTIFNTRNGYTPSKSNKEFWENGTVPWFRMEDIRENGRILSRATQMVSRSAVKGELFPANSIIVATSATIGEHALITVPSLANQRFTCLALKPEHQHLFNIKFLFYYCFRLDQYCKECLNQSNFASVDMKKFAKFRFPIPPLPVQCEIVQILDNFTELTAELTAELTTKKKQYEYYHDKLLTSNVIGEYKKIGEVCNLHYGKGNKIPQNGGQYPVYGCNGIVGYTDIFNSEDAPIVGHIGSAGSVTWGSGKHFVTYNGTVCTPYRDIVLSRYLYHVLISANLENKVKGNQPFLSASDFSNIRVYVPLLAIQQHIVAILDSFDALCNDLTSGLPAEIAARQKQYEYYRDKLLTFKELTA